MRVVGGCAKHLVGAGQALHRSGRAAWRAGLGQLRTSVREQLMSALLPKTDIPPAADNVGFGPVADIVTSDLDVRFRPETEDDNELASAPTHNGSGLGEIAP